MTLVVHAGARLVSREEIVKVPTPAATASWFPVAHHEVLDSVNQTLTNAGFAVRKAEYALGRDNARLFATFDLETPLAEGVGLSVGVRNSLDKSLPLSFCAGNRVFVCDNLAFRSELLVRRKHTRNGAERFREAIHCAVSSLTAFQKAEAQRIAIFQSTDVKDQEAESLILRAFESEIVSSRLLPTVIKEWREPSYADFEGRTLWSLFNAFTTALGGYKSTNPQRLGDLTMRLQGLIGGAAGLPADEPVLVQAV